MRFSKTNQLESAQMMNLRFHRAGLVAMLAVGQAVLAPLYGQSGAVSGHVVDSKRSAIAAATVDIANTATGEKQATVTNGEGYFLFPPLAPGSYLMHVSAPAFARVTIEQVTVEVGSSRSIEVTLELESVRQEITVTATAPELVTDHADRGNVIESKFVENTPLNIRNPPQLINFAQGVTPYVNAAYGAVSGNNDVSQAFTNTFRINGGKMSTTESLLDGAANTTEYDYNAEADIPQVDAIREFKVLTTAYAPEWGRTSGGIVTFATKSGTNQFHGSVFEYLRNSALDARGFNANAARLPVTHFQRNQFGYSLGGPVTIPRVYRGRDRTFFFATYEGLRQSKAGSFTGTVPTALERQGDFSQTRDTNGNLIVIYDPRTTAPDPTAPAGVTRYVRAPFQGNVIPASYLNSVGVNILKYYPQPNQPGQGTSSVNNYFSDAPTTSTQDVVNVRIDHRFNEAHSIFGRFDWFQRHNNAADPYGNNLSPGLNKQRLPGDNIMGSHTWILTPSLVLEHHLAYGHQESNRVPAGSGFDPTQLGFDSSVAANLRALAFPDITGVNRIGGLGPGGGLEHDYGTFYEYAAALTQLKGKHSLKYGFDFRYFNTGLDIAPLVTVSAGSNFTGGPNPQAAVGASGSGVADLLLGAATVSSGFTPAYSFGHPYYAFYAQDTYSVTPKLNITFGLRYNLELPDIEEKNRYPFLDLTSSSPLNSRVTALGTLTGGPGFVGVNGLGARIQTAQKADFDPRFGFAYRTGDKTVIRGGFGIFHAPVYDGLNTTSVGFAAVTTSRAAQADGVTPQFNLIKPFPQGLTQPTGNTLGLVTMAGQSISGYARNQQVSYSEQWSVEVQRQLPRNLVVSVGYAGNHGLDLYEQMNYNQLPDGDLALGSKLLAQVANPFYGVITDQTSLLSAPTVQYGQLLRPHPQFQNMTTTASNGFSTYHSLQLSVERRFANGLALLFAYTHSKMIDNAGDYFLSNQPQDNNCLRCERSISSQDLPDVIRLSAQYELPFGRGKPFVNRGALERVIGGFAIGSFFTFDNGLPVAVSSPNFSNSFGGGTAMRPDATGASTAISGGPQMVNGGLFFNPAAFSPVASFTFGNASRFLASVRAPGTFNWDMLVSRRFPLRESLGLDFRAEFFNAFNNVQYGGPNTNISSSSFGHIFLTQVNTPRQIQASLRLSF
jgi:hypothetical protein